MAFEADFRLADIVIDDSLMANAVPARKMFSSRPVSDAQYTEDNRGTSMASIRAMSKIAEENNGLRKAVPNTVRPQQLTNLNSLVKMIV